MEIPFEGYSLDNGLRVVLSPERRLPVVAINLWYNVGSRNERPGRTGFAHLFEHMMFQGSENVPDNGHFGLIERAGGTLNGSTWLDRTNYFETLPAHYLELGLWLEADRMGNLLPAMTQVKLDNQRDVVKNERRWRIDNQPYGDWDERIQEMMFPPEHPYHHSVIGSMADLDAASLHDVAEFFRTYYAPNNAVLTICGDYDREEAMLLVDRYFGRIPSGPPVPPIPGETQLPTVLGSEIRQEVQQDISLSRLYLAYRTPAYGDAEFYAGAVATYILAWGKASLLYRHLVRGRAVLQDVTAYAFPIVVGASMLVLWSTARPGVAQATVESEVFARIASLKDVSQDDVDRAKNLIESRQRSELQRVDERADQLSMHTTLFGDPGRVNTEMDRIRRVSADDIRAFAGRFLNEDNRAVLWYIPDHGASG